MGAETDTTEDAVLGGRLRLRQPRRGHRVGHDAILLAAAVDAGAGERAADLGAGVGGAGLALALRLPGLAVTLVEIDAGLGALAGENAVLNGLADRVKALVGDAENPDALGLAPGSFDRVLMNPPFNDPRRQNVSPDVQRRLAHVAASGLLARWVQSAARLLNPEGVLTLIWRAEGLAEVQAALKADFGALRVLPVLPRPGAPAIRVIVRAVKGGQGPPTTLAGLVLNDARNEPSAEAEAVLRGGEALRLI